MQKGTRAFFAVAIAVLAAVSLFTFAACSNSGKANDIEHIYTHGLKYAVGEQEGTCVVMNMGIAMDGADIIIPKVYEGKTVVGIKDKAFLECNIRSVVIPDSVTYIGNLAFYNCSGLTSVTIGNSVTSIGYDSFRGCSGLESITVLSGNTKYHSNGNCLIETETKTLVLGCKNSIIPSDGSVTTIGSYAFDGCSGHTSITIPDSVTSIGDRAFYNCSGLTSVTIGNSVTSIGDRAFYNCSGLTSITIPNSVIFIDDLAFWVCDSLTQVNYKGTKEQWNKIQIGEGNSALTSAKRNYI